jgi:hypothetical protein
VIDKELLMQLYNDEQLSLKEVSLKLGCSLNKVAYWAKKHNIEVRTRSDANYLLHNRGKKPFTYRKPDTNYLWQLYGLGLGLYWGEGTKASKNSVRLGNSDKFLLNKFIEFLVKIYNIDTTKLRFGIQIFDDVSKEEAMQYWSGALGFDESYFMNPTRISLNKKGSYKRKSKYGVVTIYFHNTKLRNLLVDSIPKNGVKYKS